MGLSEPRRRQVIGPDPQNTKWVQERGVGHRLLAAMGWSEGSGLGREASGRTENIKVVVKDNLLGIGAGHKTASHADTQFEDLYTKLNVGVTQIKPQQQDAPEVSLRIKSHRAKFRRNKNVAAYKDSELAEIFGISREKVELDKQKKAAELLAAVNPDFMTTAAISSTDYFKQKMLALESKTSEMLNPCVELDHQTKTSPESLDLTLQDESCPCVGVDHQTRTSPEPLHSSLKDQELKKKKRKNPSLESAEKESNTGIAVGKNEASNDDYSVSEYEKKIKEKKKKKRRRMDKEITIENSSNEGCKDVFKDLTTSETLATIEESNKVTVDEGHLEKPVKQKKHKRKE